jgi:hypothetical protein
MHPDEDTMRRTLCSNLTPEDRATHAKWVRVVATVYGCAALLLLLVAITPMRRLLLSSELGAAAQYIHPGKRASGWTLEIVELARSLTCFSIFMRAVRPFGRRAARIDSWSLCEPAHRLSRGALP